jgi:RNA polymerase sigma-70 factor, ECF subfamily
MGEQFATPGFRSMADPKRYEEFARLIRLNTRQVLAYVNALVLDWNDADDLFQETCLVLWQKFDEFRPGTNFLAWALRIADHKVMKFQAMQSRHLAFTASLRDTLKTDFVGQGSDEPSANLTALSGCMDRLPPSDQRILKLCYVESIPIRQIADAINRPQRGVEKSLYRIRNWLLDCVHRELNKANMVTHTHSGTPEEEDKP